MGQILEVDKVARAKLEEGRSPATNTSAIKEPALKPLVLLDAKGERNLCSLKSINGQSPFLVYKAPNICECDDTDAHLSGHFLLHIIDEARRALSVNYDKGGQLVVSAQLLANESGCVEDARAYGIFSSNIMAVAFNIDSMWESSGDLLAMATVQPKTTYCSMLEPLAQRSLETLVQCPRHPLFPRCPSSRVPLVYASICRGPHRSPRFACGWG